MAWECAVCRKKEDPSGKDSVKIDAVCHHCGKPLCNDSRHRIVIVDPDFSLSDGVSFSEPGWGDAGAALGPQAETRPKAVHCKSCKEKYHKGAREVSAEPGVSRPMSA